MPPRILLSLFLLLVPGLHLHGETEVDKALQLLKAGNTPAARAKLEGVVQADARNAEAWYQLGGIGFQEGRMAKAQECADKAIALQPARADFHVLRGRALGNQAQNASMFKALGLAKDGLAALEKAVQLEPANRAARGALFNWYFQVPAIGGGGLGKALAFAEQTVPIHAALGHLWKALVLQKRKDPGAAQAEARAALAADPRLSVAYNLLGYVELEMKQVDQALADFRRQVELAPEDPNAHDSLGDGLMAKGLAADAVASYRRGLELNPRFWGCAANLGTALEQAGRREEAIAHYQRYVQLGGQHGAPAVASRARDALKRLGVKG